MTAPRFTVVTSSTIESGTTIAYLLQTTPIKIDKIYFDTMQSFRKSKSAPVRKPRWFSSWDVFRQHARLAWAMPRHYLFKAFKKCLGLSEMSWLYALERISPRLLPLACGFPVPARPGNQPLLRKLPHVAAEHGIPLVATPSLNSEETVASLKDEQPDVVIGLGTRILSAPLLQTALLGFLNAHSSLLPDYRGGGTEFWQLKAGERRTGVTIHWMAPRVDEGPLCAQKTWAIPRRTNHHRLRLMSFFQRLELWRDVVIRLQKGEVPRLAQREARTPTFKAPTVGEQYAFYRKRA